MSWRKQREGVNDAADQQMMEIADKLVPFYPGTDRDLLLMEPTLCRDAAVAATVLATAESSAGETPVR